MSTIPSAFLETVKRDPDLVALVDGLGNATRLSYAQYADQVARFAAGLRAHGARRGDRIALLFDNCVEFHIADLAAQFAGLIPFSVYTASTPEQLAFVLKDSGATLLICDAAYLDKAKKATEGLHTTMIVAGKSVDSSTWSSLLEHEPVDLASEAAAVEPDDIATIIYTSGTTGPPKGVMLTQKNVFQNAQGYIQRSETDVSAQHMVSYLPMAHIAERVVSFYAAVVGGQTVWPCRRVSELPDYLKLVRPGALFGVPLIWERLKTNIEMQMAQRGRLNQLFQWSLVASHSWVPLWRQCGRLTRRLFARRILETIGLNQLRYASSGGAGIDPSVIAWFRDLGVPLTESYGMSESSGPMTWTPQTFRPGSSGQAMPNVSVRIAKDGEILCKGPTVFAGYWGNEARTKEVLRDGWLHTGDIGEIDRKGYVSVVGRKKDIIVTRGGENFSPANIESALSAHPLIAQACVVGDGKPYLAALIVVDEAEARQYFTNEGIEFASLSAVSTHERLIGAVSQIVDTVNAAHSRGEQLRRFKVLDHTWENNFELLTPTLKPKRRAILERYAREIDSLYG